jgi:hypothetical protein
MYHKAVEKRKTTKRRRTPPKPNKKPSLEQWALWLSALALVVSSGLTYWSIRQNSKALETAQNAFQISIDSTIDIDFPTKDYSSEFSIRNTSSVDIADVEVFPICYFIRKESEGFKIISRHPLESFKSPNEILKPGQISKMPLKSTSCSQLPKNTSKYINSLVVVFHRLTDNKRFIKIEPFTMSEDDPNPEWASSLYAEGSWAGDPIVAVGIIEKIKETEKVLFKVD